MLKYIEKFKTGSEISRELCPATGNTRAVSVHFQLPVCVVLVSSRLRLYLVVFFLCSFYTAASPAAAERLRAVNVFEVCKRFHR
jgi:hypothetical protein